MILPDNQFLARVYFILPQFFGFRPKITLEQFFKYGYAESKILLVIDVLNLIKRKHKYLSVKSSLCKNRPRSSVCYSRGGPNRMTQNMVLHTSSLKPVEFDDFRKSARLTTAN